MKPRALYSPQPARGWLPWGALAPFLTIGFAIADMLATAPLLEHYRLADKLGEPIGMNGLFAILLIPFIANVLIVLGWVRFVERRPLATIGLTGPRKAWTYGRGVLIGWATILGVVAATWAAGGYQAHGYGEAFASPAALASLAILFACFVVQAGVEEILFRGWLMSVVARKFNVPLAIVLTSVTFAFMHYSPHQRWLITLNMFLFSAFCCAWALKANNILGVMGWHAGWNWLLGSGFGLPVTGIEVKAPALLVSLTGRGPDALTGGAQGPEGSIACGLFFAAATAILLWRARKPRPDRPAEAADSVTGRP